MWASLQGGFSACAHDIVVGEVGWDTAVAGAAFIGCSTRESQLLADNICLKKHIKQFGYHKIQMLIKQGCLELIHLLFSCYFSFMPF